MFLRGGRLRSLRVIFALQRIIASPPSNPAKKAPTLNKSRTRTGAARALVQLTLSG
jgi:hypothetical protein